MEFNAKFEKNTYFYSKGTENPELSNFYKCDFKVDGVYYNCAEQYLFAKKAELVGDLKNQKWIMSLQDPVTMKSVGRQIQWPSTKANWNWVAIDLLWIGCWAKFSQNKHLRRKLLSTTGSLLAETSEDPFYGIGFKAAIAPSRNEWIGDNHFGLLLTLMRERMSTNLGPFDEVLRRNSDSSYVGRRKRGLERSTPPSEGKRSFK